ncbi:MAG: Mur ligase domain-containing protein, partial [Dethiobacteria bacterium]
MIMLQELLSQVEILESKSSANPAISGLAYHSERVQPGSLFFCIKGFKTDGHCYLERAKEKGAAAAIVEEINPLVE